MGRRRSSEEGITLFPFLSILVCVIGVLTLMIVGASLSDINTPPDPKLVELTRESRELQRALTEDEKAVKELASRLDSSGFGKARITSARRELEQLEDEKKKRDEADKEKLAALDKQKQRDLLKEHLSSLESDAMKRAEVLAELDEEIERKKKPPEAAVSIRPTGTGTDFDPTFVECAETSILLWTGDEPVRVRTADIAVSPEYRSLLKSVASGSDGIVIFLLRSTGTATYEAARAAAIQEGCRNGKIPILGQGRIDLSIVQKKKRKD